MLKYNRLYSLLLLLITYSASAQNKTVEFSVNGLKVILKQTQKETIVMSMYFRGGSTNYQPANAGIESLALSGILDCGTSKFSANDFNDLSDEYDFHLLGKAENDYGVVKLGCISKYTDQAWKLFSSAITTPAFEEQKFNFLKEQKIDQLKDRLSNPDERLSRLAQEFAFMGTNYAVNPEGTVASLTTLDRDAVKNYYYNTLLNKRRMFLVVAGNISKEDIEKKVQDAFASIPEKVYEPANIENTLFTKDLFKIEERSIATNYVGGIINAPSLNSDDYPAFRVFVTILNSGLFDVIRVKRQLSYAPSASLSQGKISYVTMYASTTQPKETVSSMQWVLSRIKDNTYSEKTLNAVRKHVLQAYMRQQEVMSDIVNELGEAEIIGNWQLAENLVERMNKVTPKEVQRIANAYTKNINWVYIGNKQLGKESFKEL